MSQKERVMIFVDHNNILHVFMQRGFFRFNYLKLREIVTNKRNTISTKIYLGIEPSKTRQIASGRKSFFDFLRRNDFELYTARVRISPSGKRKEKEIDVKLATDMLSSAFENLYDTCVLVSGDGDFKPVLEKIISLGKNVEIWAFKETISQRLSQLVLYNNLNFLDDYLDELRL